MSGKMVDQAIHEAVARSDIYRLLAAAFLYPDEALLGVLSRLDTGDGGFEPDGRPALVSCLRPPVSLDALRGEYLRIFGHVISRECPPYETEYGSAHVFQQSQMLGDIAGFYRAFGLEVSEQAKERLDHIAIELEFMSFLTFKEAYALAHDGEERVSICRDAQRIFLEEHLARWAPLFARRLRRKAAEGFYRDLAAVLETFLSAECGRIGARTCPVHDEALRVIPAEPDGGCASYRAEAPCFMESKEDEG